MDVWDGAMEPAGRGRETEIDFSAVLAVADAVLFEGYLLYPYRRSSVKNRVRWQFGVLAPRSWIDTFGPHDDGVSGSAESWWNQTECLLEAAPDAELGARVRFLRPAEGGDGLQEAVPCDVGTTLNIDDLLGTQTRVPISQHAEMAVRSERLPARSPLHRITVRVENTTPSIGADLDRPAALRYSMVSTHVLLGVNRGSFLSLLDPPEWARQEAASCRNVRAFPVLADPAGSARFLLSAPIILPDHPQVAPESPGDLFDATEIDEILSLRTLTLTDAEKMEVRATDQRASELLDRVETTPPEVLSRLHGAVRSLRPVRRAPVADTVTVGGIEVQAGSRVRLWPREHGTDAQDMFLAGRLATVRSVLTDVDGRRFLGVTIDDDPRSAVTGGPGQMRHFAPGEVEPVPFGEGAPG